MGVLIRAFAVVILRLILKNIILRQEPKAERHTMANFAFLSCLKAKLTLALLVTLVQCFEIGIRIQISVLF
jgi:hypothetical protein